MPLQSIVLRTGGSTVIRTGTLTRPANTTGYAAGDAVTDSTSAPTVFTIPGIGRENGKSGIITGARLILSSNPTTKGDFTLYIFDTTYTPDNDNAAFTPTDAEMKTCLGTIDFLATNVLPGDATSGGGGNCIYFGNLGGEYISFKCEDASASLYFALVNKHGGTPHTPAVNSEEFTVRLSIEQN